LALHAKTRYFLKSSQNRRPDLQSYFKNNFGTRKIKKPRMIFSQTYKIDNPIKYFPHKRKYDAIKDKKQNLSLKSGS
jgi:hypothetical protein